MSTITTRLANDTPEAAVVRVRDGNGVDHRIAIDKESGEIAVHQYNDYPGDLDACTPEQRRMIRAARANARYTVQEETDAEIIRPTERPSSLRAGIRALESLTEAEFVRHFREYYDEIESPSATVPRERVSSVTTVCYLDGDHLEYVTGPAIEIDTGEGTRWEYTNPADLMVAPDRDPDVCCRLSPGPLPVPFGEPFRSFLLDHLRCQIRDIYWLRGEPIPPDCRLEGDGNPEVDRIRESVGAEAAGSRSD